MNKLKNKIAVIIGGSSGIGLAAAKLFNEEDAQVSIFGRDQQKLNDAKNSIKDSILVCQGDITNISDLDNCYQTTKNKLGKIDVLVVCAGIHEALNVKELDEVFFNKTVDINYKGACFAVQRAIPFLNKSASVILVSSSLSHTAKENYSIYCSSKAALNMLSKCFAIDLSDNEIRVNSISPGFVKTPMWDNISKEIVDKLSKRPLLKRFGKPEEIAKLALFLASDDSSYITGSDIVIDGGLTGISLNR